MTETQIRRNAIATLRRAYALGNEEALRYHERNYKYSWCGGINLSLYGRAERILARIERAKEMLASIGLEYYIDCGEICTRPALSKCSASKYDYRMSVEFGLVDPY